MKFADSMEQIEHPLLINKNDQVSEEKKIECTMIVFNSASVLLQEPPKCHPDTGLEHHTQCWELAPDRLHWVAQFQIPGGLRNHQGCLMKYITNF